MTITSAAATLGAALILAGTPALSLADGQEALVPYPVVAPGVGIVSGPIRIDRFSVEAANYGSLETVEITFANLSPVKATSVVFQLESRGRVLGAYRDSGTFSQGARIAYEFAENQTVSSFDPPAIAVASVSFADGSNWTNQQGVRARQSTKLQSPAAQTEDELPPTGTF